MKWFCIPVLVLAMPLYAWAFPSGGHSSTTRAWTRDATAIVPGYSTSLRLSAAATAITHVNDWFQAGNGTVATTAVSTSTGNQIQAGDVCIMSIDWYPSAGSVTFTSISGGAGGAWTNTVPEYGVATNIFHRVYTRVMTAGDVGGTFTVTWSAVAYGPVGISCFRGVNTTTPVDAAGTGTTNSSSTSITAASITLANSGDALVYLAGIDSAGGALTQPGGFTASWNQGYVATSFGFMAGYRLGVAAGATGAISGTAGTAPTTTTAVLVALRK